MKKWIALLLALLLTLTACGKKAPQAGVAQAETGPGRVCYLNSRPELKEVLQTLADAYTAETGTEVQILTPEPGTYRRTLASRMTSAEAPTIFTVSDLSELLDWENHARNLTGTALEAELLAPDLGLYNKAGELKALGCSYESFGLIVNTTLLEQAGFSLEDIRNFETLQTVVESINVRSADLGFLPFAPSGLAASGYLVSLPLYYAGVTGQEPTISGEYLELLRNFWDLYLYNSLPNLPELTESTPAEALEWFREGLAVFYPGSSGEYALLRESGMTDEQLTMIPLFCGAEGEENTALCSGTDAFWVVNARVRPEDQQASMDFLLWLVSDAEASARYAEQTGGLPFRSAAPSSNKFLEDGMELVNQGKIPIPWTYHLAPNADSWRATVTTALKAYTADPTDKAWDEVVKSFTEGWAYEYQFANS